MSREASRPGRAAKRTDDSVVYRTVHDWDGRETLADTVVVAVAQAAGVDPADLETPLFDSVDPDALDAVFRPRRDGSARSDGRLEFGTNGYVVVVRNDGEVLVRDRDQ